MSQGPDALLARDAAAREAIASEILCLKWLAAAAGFRLALRKQASVLKANFNPGQPRLPAGEPGGGQWVGEGGNAVAGNWRMPGAQYTQNDRSTGYAIDLHEEWALGGHTIEGHVAKSQNWLITRLREQFRDAAVRGDIAEGLRVGSFSSLMSATKLVNSTLAQNQDKVDLVAQGLSPRQDLVAQFSSPTGYEAYAPNERSQPYLRDTYGVHVVVVRDRRAAKGYRIDTAFPMNLDR